MDVLALDRTDHRPMQQPPFPAFGIFLDREFMRVVAVDAALLARQPRRHGQHIPVVGEPDGGVRFLSALIHVADVLRTPIVLVRQRRAYAYRSAP